MPYTQNTYLLSITGIVQGVGFRPFVWRLANDMTLKGCVYNDAGGVKIQLNAQADQLQHFIQRLQEESPALASIEHISAEPARFYPYICFEILESKQGLLTTGCAPDAATCDNCKRELFDPNNRRYRYPFINCTDCGPRLSIIRHIPYDRQSTTMAAFEQCQLCRVEYTNPADRRYHAQPNACPQCGPQLWLEDAHGRRLPVTDCFDLLRQVLMEGKVVALKGLGGFHLTCDATNADAVTALRQRKRRPDKAFALMVRDVDLLQNYAQADEESINLLSSPLAPVVLLNPRENQSHPIAVGVAPGQYQLGFMLPHTPIHHLLMEKFEIPLVMTSGNRSGSPQAITNEDAREQLSEIADLFLMHDRPIQNRVDDSVVRQVQGEFHMLRRARGYAPGSLLLPDGFASAPELVALGGELKNTLCIIKSGRAVVSQHLGDLEDIRTFEQYQATHDLFCDLYQVKSDRYACDMHPEYLSSKFAEELAEQGNQLVRVQHHHAHLASCLGDNAYPLSAPPVLGICLDGTGYGTDGTLWGGEFLFGDYHEALRVAHIKPFPLIGGTQAILQPWRVLYALLRQSLPGQDMAGCKVLFSALQSPHCNTFDKMLEQEINCPLTSSAGRLFDAVAAALGCHPEAISYEGQAAIELETLAQQASVSVKPYLMTISGNQIDPANLFLCIVNDLKARRPKEEIALAFHLGVAKALVEMTMLLSRQYKFDTVALSGGVLQNQIINRELHDQLKSSGLNVLGHNQLPANDAGLSFGQALVAAARYLR